MPGSTRYSALHPVLERPPWVRAGAIDLLEGWPLRFQQESGLFFEGREEIQRREAGWMLLRARLAGELAGVAINRLSQPIDELDKELKLLQRDRSVGRRHSLDVIEAGLDGVGQLREFLEGLRQLTVPDPYVVGVVDLPEVIMGVSRLLRWALGTRVYLLWEGDGGPVVGTPLKLVGVLAGVIWAMTRGVIDGQRMLVKTRMFTDLGWVVVESVAQGVQPENDAFWLEFIQGYVGWLGGELQVHEGAGDLVVQLRLLPWK